MCWYPISNKNISAFPGATSAGNRIIATAPVKEVANNEIIHLSLGAAIQHSNFISQTVKTNFRQFLVAYLRAHQKSLHYTFFFEANLCRADNPLDVVMGQSLRNEQAGLGIYFVSLFVVSDNRNFDFFSCHII